jgi:branched-chain amino acid aminotransferase
MPKYDLLWPDEHFTRLRQHAEHLKIQLPYTQAEIAQGINTVLERNNWHDSVTAFRITLSRGPSERGVAPPDHLAQKPQLVITGSLVDEQAIPRTASLAIAEKTRRNEGSILSQIKSLNYGDAVLCKMEAQEKGVDDCIQLNNKDKVTCTSVANIIIEKAGELYTPPLSDGVMNGIVRQKIIDTHGALEKSLTRDDLMEADHVYLTNSIIHVQTVIQIEDQKFEQGSLFVTPESDSYYSASDLI